jgi:hypothetical protein
MKKLLQALHRQLMVAIGLTAVGVLAAALIPNAPQLHTATAGSFPAVACPSSISGANAYAYLPSSKIGVRSIKKGSLTSSPARAYRLPVSNPILVNGDPQTTLFAESANGWWASSICSAGTPESWFVGGSAGLSSAGFVQLVNSGLSDSIVDLTAYAPAGPRALSSVTVPANSELRVPLDTLAPGDDLIAVHAITRSGRITAFLFDQRKKGLRALGADFVPAAAAPLNHLVIPGLVNSSAGNGAIAHSVRILVPGTVDATVNVTINSTDGAFTPVGLDNLKVAHGQVVDIPLTNLTVNSAFSVVVDSDCPALAGVLSLSSKGGADIAWAGSAQALPRKSPISINVGGHSPSLIAFSSDNYGLSITYTLASGATKSASLSGSGELIWNSPAAVNRITIESNSEKVFAALAFTPAKDGSLSYVPLQPGTTLQAALLPQADARVISRGQ